MRKILIFILIFILISGGIWYFFFKKTPTVPDTGPIQTSFFPNDEEVDFQNTDGALNSTTQKDLPKISPFKQLSANPIAGYSAFLKTITTSIPSTTPKGKPATTISTDHVVRYVSRANGYVYELQKDDSPLQISNIYIPNIYEALFSDNSMSVLLRFLRPDGRTIATYTVPVPEKNPDGTRTQKEGIYLPDGIKSIALSSDTKQIARIVGDQTQTTLTTSTTLGTAKKEWISSPFREWLVSWPTKESLYVQTKAAASAEGFLYRVTNDRKLSRILGNIKGLTTSISPDGQYVLYSQSTSAGYVAKILDTKTAGIQSVNLAILPEKCAWLANSDLICAGNNEVPKASYPDAWYAGIVSLKDKFYRISTKTNTFTILYEGDHGYFDATNIQLDESQNLLYFIDKTTGFLWRFLY